MTRKERAAEKKVAMVKLREEAKASVLNDRYGIATKCLEQAKILESDIATLEKYPTDEDHRKALVTRMRNGYN